MEVKNKEGGECGVCKEARWKGSKHSQGRIGEREQIQKDGWPCIFFVNAESLRASSKNPQFLKGWC